MSQKTSRAIGLVATIAIALASCSAVALSNPVLFVHGLWSDASTWEEMIGQLAPQLGATSGGRLRATLPSTGPESCEQSDTLGSDRKDTSYVALATLPVATRSRLASARLFAVDFSDGSDLTFAQQAGELKTVIDCVKSITGQTSVSLVGHSMGGIASRHYLQNLGQRPYGNDVDRLVTIGTPHDGARGLVKLAYALPQWGPNTSIAQLAPGSCAIRIMNESLGSNASANLLRDCGFGSTTILPAITYTSVIGYDYDRFVLGDTLGVIPADVDDGLVGVDSQNMRSAVAAYPFPPHRSGV